MKDNVISVKIFGKNIGYSYWDDKQNCAIFQYDDKFIKSGLDISPLKMPLKKNAIYSFSENAGDCFSGLPGLLADSLPDKYGIEQINTYFSSKGKSDIDITPLDRLCYIGKRGMGALEFEPQDSYKELDESSVISIKELITISQEIFTSREEFIDKLIQKDKRIIDVLKVGTSAGGAKPKAIIAWNQHTNDVRSGQVQAPEGYSYWLLKFDGGEFLENDKICKNPKGIGQIEYAYHLMATACGIDMSECRLLEEDDNFHFMTKRFDRAENGDKIHMQTLAGIAHYDRDKACSYEQLFTVMRKLNLPKSEQVQMFKRMVFNVAARNHDDHTKNHSFLMNRKGDWSLAPAYDLCYSYNAHGRFTKNHQMYINGKNNEFTAKDLQEVANRIGISDGNQIINEIMDTVSSWSDFAKKAGVRKEYAEEIEKNLLCLKVNDSKTISTLDESIEL